MGSATRHRVQREELSAALEPALAQHFGEQRRLRRLRRRISAYASSCTIENLEVELEGGQKLSLVFKDLSPAALLSEAKQVRPGFHYAPQREIETYAKILHSRRLGTALCYGSVSSAAQGRYWLFLERVPGSLLCQVGRMETWEQAARWLAKLHSEFEVTPPAMERGRFAHLERHDAAFYRVWLARAEEFLRRRHERTLPETCRKFLRLAGRYDRLVARLLALPPAFIHGEFYPSNIIVGEAGNPPRLCPVDWELAGIAPGLIDLAALIAGEWTDGDRNKMIAAYRDALEPAHNWPPSLPELREAVECCQLHWCVKWLGWASDWSPPAHHAQNWLQEAFRLAGRVGL